MRSVATPDDTPVGQSMNRDTSPLDRHTHEPTHLTDRPPSLPTTSTRRGACGSRTNPSRSSPNGSSTPTSPTPRSVSTPSSCATAIPPGNACPAGNCWLSGCTVLLTPWTGLSASSPTPASSASSTAGPDGATSPTATTSPRRTRMGAGRPGVAADLPPPRRRHPRSTRMPRRMRAAVLRVAAHRGHPRRSGGRGSAGRVAAEVRPDPEKKTQEPPPPTPPRPPRAGSSRWREEDVLTRCGITDLDALVERCRHARQALDRPTGRWTRHTLMAAIQLALTRGWPPTSSSRRC